MNESLKKSTHLSLSFLHHSNKVVHSLSELGGEQVLNQSVEVDDDDGSEGSVGSEEVLRMEVKQLKRENAFLKGKIEELKKGTMYQKTPVFLKRQSINCANILKKRPDTKVDRQQNSLNFILAQIHNVLKSLASLYKVQIPEKRWIINSSSDMVLCQHKNNSSQQLQQQSHIDQQQKGIKSHNQQFTRTLNRKLQMVALQKQQHRYQSMLGIFSQYYQIKVTEQKKVKQRIEQFIEKTIEISKRLVEKANYRAYQKTMRSSSIYSVQQEMEIGVNNGVNNSDNNDATNNNGSNNTGSNNFFPHIRLNDSYIFGPRQKFSGKHQLSYSTIDGQNPYHRDIN